MEVVNDRMTCLHIEMKGPGERMYLTQNLFHFVSLLNVTLRGVFDVQ